MQLEKKGEQRLITVNQTASVGLEVRVIVGLGTMGWQEIMKVYDSYILYASIDLVSIGIKFPFFLFF